MFCSEGKKQRNSGDGDDGMAARSPAATLLISSLPPVLMIAESTNTVASADCGTTLR
jgi:hypothetical protein